MAEIDEFNDKPKGTEDNLANKKGIRLFMGNSDRAFLERVGRELTEKILQESMILYRIDLKKTQTHSLYKEAKRKVWLPEIEIFGRINVEQGETGTQTAGGILNKKFGALTSHVYLSHLEELSLIKKDNNDIQFLFREGDFIGHKGQFYKIIDNGFTNISNQFTFNGDQRFYITIKAIESNEDVFKGR